MDFERIESLKKTAGFNPTFQTHIKAEEWGFSVFIMGYNGRAMCRMYWYKDDITTIYLDMLSVNPNIRKRGIGTYMQKLREQFGRVMGAKCSYLWVKDDTWMKEWYIRRGYVEQYPYENEKDAIWLMKKL